jgi:hypothetical protein
MASLLSSRKYQKVITEIFIWVVLGEESEQLSRYSDGLDGWDSISGRGKGFLCPTASRWNYWTHPTSSLMGEVKEKLSLYRPWRPLGLREVEAPTFSDIRLTDGGNLSKGYEEQSSLGVKLSTHLHLVPRSRMAELYFHSPIRLQCTLLN